MNYPNLSVILPARNEASVLAWLLPMLRAQHPNSEIVVVDDGSVDNTHDVCEHNGVTVVSHPYRMGNGAAVKAGARKASGKVLVFMDADGQHDPSDIHRLLVKLEQGYDMVVGARNRISQANVGRSMANRFYNWLASHMVGQRVEDLTSGFRAVRAERFKEYLDLLPNGFSYPTTITMAFFRSGYAVGYVPIHANTRTGKSHIRPLYDGLRFVLIIFRIGTLYSPLKLFLPISLVFFLIGLGYYGYTFSTQGRFTNMSALLLVTSVLIFLIGLISEQITNLLYLRARDK